MKTTKPKTAKSLKPSKIKPAVRAVPELPPAGLALKQILVPTDFSRLSQQAIRWAKFMAEPAHGTIHLVHVHDFEFAIPSEVALELISPADVDRMLRQDL